MAPVPSLACLGSYGSQSKQSSHYSALLSLLSHQRRIGTLERTRIDTLTTLHGKVNVVSNSVIGELGLVV